MANSTVLSSTSSWVNKNLTVVPGFVNTASPMTVQNSHTLPPSQCLKVLQLILSCIVLAYIGKVIVQTYPGL